LMFLLMGVTITVGMFNDSWLAMLISTMLRPSQAPLLQCRAALVR